MSIPSINASYHSGSSDPRLDRTWAKRSDVEILTEQVRILQERIATLERDFTHEIKHPSGEGLLEPPLPTTTGYFKNRKRGL